MLLLVASIGVARGFTIAQLCVVVNALAGILILREPEPGSRAARHAIFGILLALVGAIVLGAVKESP
tara:strand:+ start:105 stop:305 length:201 start_codon:yes stop_codon:yes gene_type:complete